MKIRDRVTDFRRVLASELLPHPANWRMHPPEQADAMRGVLAELGFCGACLVRETPEGLQLIDGHLRAEIAPDAKLPCLVLDVTEEEARKLLATFDPLGAMAEADEQALGELLAGLEVESEAVQAMLAKLAEEYEIDLTEDGVPPEDPGAEVDRAGELMEKWGVKVGQLWLIEGKAGTHRVLCGDSTKAEDVGRAIGGTEPFLMVTDPPYGVEYDATWRDDAPGQVGGPRRSRGEVKGDDTCNWTDALSLFLGDVAYVWHASLFTGHVWNQLVGLDFEIRASIIWRKQQAIFSRGHYHWQHEPCWYAVRKERTAKWSGDRTQSTVWDIHCASGWMRERLEKTCHSAEKPLECMARPIRNHGTGGDVAFDPFLGSGTTLVACEQLGRIGVGIEIEPKYVAVTLERLAGMGLTPQLAEG